MGLLIPENRNLDTSANCPSQSLFAYTRHDSNELAPIFSRLRKSPSVKKKLIWQLAWTWDSFDFFTVSVTLTQIASTLQRSTTDISWGNDTHPVVGS